MKTKVQPMNKTAIMMKMLRISCTHPTATRSPISDAATTHKTAHNLEDSRFPLLATGEDLTTKMLGLRVRIPCPKTGYQQDAEFANL